ncbi:MAG TPA: ABC transporter permease [Blastocatellia bacterium]|nr:ABC transporter permease [Blastocatellia bacterium]
MNWWYRLWHRKRMEEQLDRELRFHLDRHLAELIEAGCDPEEARRRARLTLGGLEQVRERCRDARGTRWLEDLWTDFRYAIRALRRRPGFAAIALLILALGNGATTVMFTVLNSVLLRPLSYPEPERLVTVHGSMENFGEFWGFSNLDFTDARRQSRSLEMAAWAYGGSTISEPGEPAYAAGRQISAELFSVLKVALKHGRAFRSDEDRPGATPVVIIGHDLWRLRFGGDPAAVGRRIVLDGKPYTIAGIAPAGFQLSGEVDVFTPLGQNPEPRMENRAARFVHVVARLRPDAALAEARAELALISRQLAQQYPDSNAGLSMPVRPLQEELVGEVGSTLWLLLAAVGLVLLIACVNIASLLLARAVSREREIAVRVALGASRGRLIRQFLTESAVLGLSGGAIGVFLAILSVQRFILLWPGRLPRAEEIRLDGRVLLFALIVSIASGILFGLAPALRVPVDSLERVLRAGARSLTGSTRRLHSIFVISEIALAVVLLASAGILGRTLLALSALDPGLNVRNVLTARFALSTGALSNPEQIRAAWQEVLDQARRIPDVESVALADIIPMREGENSLSYWTTPTPPPLNQAPLALASTATPDYLKVMGIPLRRGRFFDEGDRLNREPVVVIDEYLEQHAFGGQDAVGKYLWIQAMGPAPLRIVGVVGHVRHWGLAGDDQSRVRDQIYYPFAQVPDRILGFFSTIMSIAVRTKIPPLDLVGPMNRELRGANGDQTFYAVRTMEQLVSASLARQRFLMLLFGIFAGLALLMACVGIYGVLAYRTTQRIPELGVRMALGADAHQVLWLVLRQSFGMILIGAGLGTVAALAAGRLLKHVVPGVRPMEPLTLAAMVALLMAAALLASFIPARRASRIDPISALHQE